jgi:serine phosphatase RsbU (regulator of sigma subunit)
VWAGTLNGGVSKFKDGHFTTYTTTNGLASNAVSSILETRDGVMWFATPSGLSSFSNGQWRTYTTVEGLPSPEVNCLFEDSSGTLWSGTSAGLAFFASNGFQVPHESPDVLREQIVGMAEDKSERFWIATSDHVLRVPRDKLLRGVVKAVDTREYDQADGLESTEGVKRSRSVVSDSAGRIWFSLSNRLSVVNPSQITDNSVPALPHVEAITADNSPLDLADTVRLPPSPRRITFEYTGLSLAVPERIRFRYFLEGFDNSWSQPVAARQAVYTNLEPGSYRFRLVASNSEGLWNGPETAIALNVAPAYYQTWWFRSLCGAAFLALLVAAYRLRLLQVARQFNRMEAERRAARDMEIAKQVQDRLFPQKLLQLVTLEYAGRCMQARQVGGDYYDFLSLGPGRMGIVLADIAGKGIPGALLMANLQAAIRSQCAIASQNLAQFLRSVNQSFYESTDEDSYTTLFFGDYQDATCRLQFANCGHNPPFLVRANGTAERLGSTATVLGLFEKWDSCICEVKMAAGDVLVIYTDGITEANNSAGEEFGEARLLETIRANAALAVPQLADAILAAAMKFSGGEKGDDLTLVVARCREFGNRTHAQE